MSFEAAGNLSLEDIVIKSLPGRGKFLFRYKSNVDSKDGRNYTHEELTGGAVHLSKPECFNDPFDSRPACDMKTASLKLAKNYLDVLRWDGEAPESVHEAFVAIRECYKRYRNSGGVLDFSTLELNEGASLAFGLITDLLIKFSGGLDSLSEESLCLTLTRVLEDEMAICSNHMRIACFSSNANSNYMWAHYSNNYKGICIAYPFPGGAGVELDENLSWLANVIYPVRYSLERYDMSESIADMAIGKLGKREIDALFARTYLSKGIEWFQEREWRLALVRNDGRLDGSSCVPFPKPVFVLAGCKMPDRDYAKLEEICSKREIAVVKTKESMVCFQPEIDEDSGGADVFRTS